LCVFYNQPKFIIMKLVLTSTVVAPKGQDGAIIQLTLTGEQFAKLAGSIETNFCGHPDTIALIRGVCPNLPDQLMQTNADGTVKINPFTQKPQGAFWDGQGVAICATPKGGARNAAPMTPIEALSDLEFLIFTFVPFFSDLSSENLLNIQKAVGELQQDWGRYL
jgi:hypothetical protein